MVLSEKQNEFQVAFDGQSFQYIRISEDFVRGETSHNIRRNTVKDVQGYYYSKIQYTAAADNKINDCLAHFQSHSGRNKHMDATMHTPFCIPLKQQSNHGAKSEDEGGAPPRSLSLSSQSHSSRLDNSNEGCNRSSTAMDVPPSKVDTFAAFLPRKFFFKFISSLCIKSLILLMERGAPQRSESLNDDQINSTKVVPLSSSQSVVISCDSKSFLFKSIAPYVHQPTTVPKAPSEVNQPPVLPSAHLTNGSLATNQTLPLPHCSFSVPTTNATTVTLSHGPCCDRAADDSLCKKRDPLPVKETLHEDHCCENAPRRLKLKTTDGPSPGLRPTYGRSGWHDGSRQSMLPCPGPGASRCYTKPSPSLPLLPLGQACGRGAPRRLILSSFTESHCCGAESFSEPSGFRNNKEGNEQAYNSYYVGNVPSIPTSSIMQSTYSGANITYTAAGTAPPPKTFRGDPDQVVICSSTTSGRTVTYPYLSKSTYSYAECDTDHSRASLIEGICKSSMHNNGKYSKRTYSTNIARPPTTVINPSLRKESNHIIHGSQTNSIEEYEQNFKEDKNADRPTTSMSTFSKFYFLSAKRRCPRFKIL